MKHLKHLVIYILSVMGNGLEAASLGEMLSDREKYEAIRKVAPQDSSLLSGKQKQIKSAKIYYLFPKK